MTPEQRLKQIEVLMATAAKGINANTEAIAQTNAQVRANSEAITRNFEAIAQTNARMGEAIEIIVDTLRVIREMQAEVRGLQVENRRILAHLFGENPEATEGEN